MKKLLRLSRLIKIAIIFTFLLTLKVNISLSAVDIWENKEKKNNINKDQETIIINSPIILEDEEETSGDISEQEISDQTEKLIGLIDPEENDFNLSMWSSSDGNEIKSTFKRINKLKLSKFSEDLLFKVLFTNSYTPKSNLTLNEFNKIKIDWLIKNKRLNDLEKFVTTNPTIGKEIKAIKFLVNESLSNADIKSVCQKIEILEKSVENNYLEKLKIYCLINNDRKEEAQLIYELLKERGFKDKFFEDKINFLLGLTNKTDKKIIDNNLFNFYLSHITNENFEYLPNEKTDKYIWRYLSSANLIKIEEFENEDIILTYEKAAAENSFDVDDVFEIYLKMDFNFNQLLNAKEIYKNLPNYKARALIYQSILLSDDAEKKIHLSFLLKDLFIKDKILNIYVEELSNILNTIDPSEIPSNYTELVNENLEKNIKSTRKIKFDNDVLHRSKVIKYFIDKNARVSKTEKDFKSIYKKIKKNKKYFISIKDIIVLESLAADGFTLPLNLEFSEISSQLTVPENLKKLVKENQIGLVMLKIIEIIGEDNIESLDPETLYFLNKILNQLNLKKIRNNILSEVLPVRI